MKKNYTNISRVVFRHYLPVLKCLFFLLLVVTTRFGVTAQTPDIKISGKINAVTGEALSGVSVAVKNTTRMTTTDGNGDFVLDAPGNAILVITYVGFARQEVSVSDRTVLAITMVAGENMLGDVI